MRTLIITSLLLLASCAPYISAAGPDSVTIRRDPSIYSETDTRHMAESYCAERGLQARKVASGGSALGRRNDSYECIEP